MIAFILLFISFFTPLEVHDFHVSRLTLEYKPEEQHFEVALHVFTDDLELALKERGATNLRLNTEFEAAHADDLIVSYLDDMLQLKSGDDHRIYMEYLGKEPSDDFMASWIYFYWNITEEVDQFRFTNRLFHEIYDDQQNIFKLVGCQPRGLRLLTSQKDEVIITCE